MTSSTRRVAPILLLVAAAGASAGCGERDEPAPRTGTAAVPAPPAAAAPTARTQASLDAFFEAAESGDDAAALAALPADLRSASPYDEKTAALPMATRDADLYARLSARMETGAAASRASRLEAAVPFALGVIAFRKGDMEGARRAFLVTVMHDPLHRMAHLYLARVYGALEEAAMRTPEARSAGAILAERVGIGSSDTHVEMAQEIVDRTSEEALASLDATFLLDQGSVRDVKVASRTASGNARMQRPAAASPGEGSFRIVLVGADREVLDERWFAPRARLYVDGAGPDGMHEGSHTDRTTFPVTVELLSIRPGERVLIFDATGKRISRTAVR